MTNFSPVFRIPITDLTPFVASHQYHGRCPEFEMKMMECFEAYGYKRGEEKCKLLIEDFKECTLQTKQNKRIQLMREERERQYKAGERSKEDRYAKSPIVDSY